MHGTISGGAAAIRPQAAVHPLEGEDEKEEDEERGGADDSIARVLPRELRELDATKEVIDLAS